MEMKSLESYGIPSYILDIWEKNYSHRLMPVQERAVKDYGVLDYKENTRLPRRFTPRNDNHPHPALSPQGRGNYGFPPARE